MQLNLARFSNSVAFNWIRMKWTSVILAVKNNTVLAHHGENKPINDQVSFHNEYKYKSFSAW